MIPQTRPQTMENGIKKLSKKDCFKVIGCIIKLFFVITPKKLWESQLSTFPLRNYSITISSLSEMQSPLLFLSERYKPLPLHWEWTFEIDLNFESLDS